VGDRIDDLLAGLTPGVDFPGTRPLRAQVEAEQRTKKIAEETPRWDSKPIFKLVKGERVEFFTVGDLAAALNRRPVTIRSWESKGWLPISGYRTRSPQSAQIPDKATKGRRLYTRRQIEIVIEAAAASGVDGGNLRSVDWKKFKTLVLNGWRSER
jgi:hypothetical protein